MNAAVSANRFNKTVTFNRKASTVGTNKAQATTPTAASNGTPVQDAPPVADGTGSRPDVSEPVKVEDKTDRVKVKAEELDAAVSPPAVKAATVSA